MRVCEDLARLGKRERAQAFQSLIRWQFAVTDLSQEVMEFRFVHKGDVSPDSRESGQGFKVACCCEIHASRFFRALRKRKDIRLDPALSSYERALSTSFMLPERKPARSSVM